MVDDLFVPSSKPPSVLYCKLTDFSTMIIHSVLKTPQCPIQPSLKPLIDCKTYKQGYGTRVENVVVNFCVLFEITSSFEWLWTERLELMKCILQLVARRQSSSRRYKILRYNTPSVILDRSFSSPKRDYDSLTTIG